MNQKKTKILKSDWPKPKKRWKPKDGQVYWSVFSVGMIDWAEWDGDAPDVDRFEFYNCFKTAAEAIAARDKVEELLKSL